MAKRKRTNNDQQNIPREIEILLGATKKCHINFGLKLQYASEEENESYCKKNPEAPSSL
jgi:hypothetical protein